MAATVTLKWLQLSFTDFELKLDVVVAIFNTLTTITELAKYNEITRTTTALFLLIVKFLVSTVWHEMWRAICIHFKT